MMRRRLGPGIARTEPSAPTVKSEPAGGEPVAHQDGAHRADDRAGDHVARIMRGDHHPAERDQHGVNPHQRPRLRKDRADGDQRREGRGGVAGRQARVAGVPVQRLVGPDVVAGDERPGPADQAFDDRREQARQRDRGKDETQPHRPGRQNAAREPRQGRRIERSQRQQDECPIGQRNQPDLPRSVKRRAATINGPAAGGPGSPTRRRARTWPRSTTASCEQRPGHKLRGAGPGDRAARRADQRRHRRPRIQLDLAQPRRHRRARDRQDRRPRSRRALEARHGYFSMTFQFL